LDIVVVDKPAIINVDLSNSKQADLPLDSAAIKAIRHKIAWFFKRKRYCRVDNILIEVTPPSPIGSDSSDKTINAIGHKALGLKTFNFDDNLNN